MSRFYDMRRLLNAEVELSADVRAASLIDTPTFTNWSRNFDGATAWGLDEEGATATISALPTGVRLTLDAAGSNAYSLQFWNQQRNTSLANNTRYVFWLVARVQNLRNRPELVVTSEGRQIGYANLGLGINLLLSEDYQLFRVPFTTQNYTPGQLNTLPSFYLGQAAYAYEILDIKQVAITLD